MVNKYQPMIGRDSRVALNALGYDVRVVNNIDMSVQWMIVSAC